MTNMAASASRRQFKDWVNENPLRVWRQHGEVSIMETASRLGVSMTLIQLWERGVHVPSEMNMTKLISLLGPGTVERWSEWYNRRPS